MNWNPIETAPNDFAPVIVAIEGCSTSFPAYRYFVSDPPQYQYKILGSQDQFLICPAYWMPLPEPPK